MVLRNRTHLFSNIKEAEVDNKALKTGEVRVDTLVLFEVLRILWARKAQESGSAFKISIEDTVPKYILIDPLLLKKIIAILISTAINRTKNGRIGVKVGCFTLFEDFFLRVIVSDTGLGLGHEYSQGLSENFKEKNVIIKSDFLESKGAFSNLKCLTKRMGGAIKLRNADGKGTKIAFAVKTKKLELDCEMSSEFKETSCDFFEGFRILFTEANNTNAEVLRGCLEPLGVSLKRALTVEEAVKLADIHKFDLILMAIEMPILLGTHASFRIKSISNKNKQTPIAALTANVLPEDLEKYKAFGISGVCAKPYTVNKIKSFIRSVLNGDFDRLS